MNLLKASLSISAMTLLSRVTGLVRELLMAATFGAGPITDAFNVAFRLPNMFRRLFAEGAFSQAFVPVLAEYKNQQGHAATRLLVDRVTTLLILVLAAVCALGVLAAPVLVYAVAAGFANDATQFERTTLLTRILFPYIGCMSLVALAGGVLNSYGRFKVPAFTPVLLNVTFIAAFLLVVPLLPAHQQIVGLAVAVMAGGVIQLLFQIPSLKAIGLLPRFNWAPNDAGVRRILANMVPALLGVSVAQVSLVINTQIASHLGEGSVSWLSYADRLMEFPTALLGVALGTVILPSLVKHRINADELGFSKLIDWGLRLTFLLAVPAALGLALLATPLLATLFGHGRFTVQDVLQTRLPLVGYAVGLLGIVAIKVLVPGFYAKQNIKTPVLIGIAALIVTQLCNVLFVRWFDHAGLSLSISVGALFNAGALLYVLNARGGYRAQPGWWAFCFKVSLASLVMVLMLIGLGALGALEIGSTQRALAIGWMGLSKLSRIGHLVFLIAAGAGTYLGMLLLMDIHPTQFMRKELP